MILSQTVLIFHTCLFGWLVEASFSYYHRAPPSGQNAFFPVKVCFLSNTFVSSVELCVNVKLVTVWKVCFKRYCKSLQAQKSFMGVCNLTAHNNTKARHSLFKFVYKIYSMTVYSQIQAELCFWYQIFSIITNLWITVPSFTNKTVHWIHTQPLKVAWRKYELEN